MKSFFAHTKWKCKSLDNVLNNILLNLLDSVLMPQLTVKTASAFHSDWLTNQKGSEWRSHTIQDDLRDDAGIFTQTE